MALFPADSPASRRPDGPDACGSPECRARKVLSRHGRLLAIRALDNAVRSGYISHGRTWEALAGLVRSLSGSFGAVRSAWSGSVAPLPGGRCLDGGLDRPVGSISSDLSDPESVVPLPGEENSRETRT
jgi:hypothetical protein